MMKNASLKKAGIFTLAGLVLMALIILSLSVLSQDTSLEPEVPPIIEERPIKLPYFNLEVPSAADSSEIAAPAGMRTMALTSSEPSLETQRVVVILKDPSEVAGWEEAASYDSTELTSLKNVMRDYVIQSEIEESGVRNKFTTFNGFSAELTSAEIDALKQNPLVKEVVADGVAHVLLDDTTVITNATSVWGKQLYGLNITGQGVGVCILDTGLNYSHEAFDVSGNCQPTITTPRTDVVEGIYSQNYPGEYPNDYYESWVITQPGYTTISLHFANMSLEDFYDYIYIYDENRTLVYTLTGTNNDFWTPEIEGDTAIIEMTSDNIITSTGFLIDEAKNGTGVSWENCERVLGGYDFVNGDPDPIDDNIVDGGHGTHVAGIVGANSSTVKGIAPESNLIPVKVADSDGGAYFSDIIAGIEYCTKNKDKFGISVISISIGTEDPYLFDDYCDEDMGSSMFSGPIDAASAAGISVVVAAGNDANYTHISSPACIESAIPVASSTKADEISSFSNRNSLVQLVAPGGGGGAGDIYSTTIDGYGTMAGTSMATPHVSGAIALLTQYLNQRGLTMAPSELETLLNTTGIVITDPNTGLNYSRINIYAALQGILNEAPSITSVRISPTSPDTDTDLLCYVNATDTQDLALEANWTWYKDGAETLKGTKNISAGSNTLVSTLGRGNTTKGEIWNCTVSVSDGIDSSLLKSNQTTIGNALPTMQLSNITVNQSIYYPNSILIGWCNATDVDGDDVSYSWKWFKNSQLNQTGSETGISWSYAETETQYEFGAGITDTSFFMDEDWSTTYAIVPQATTYSYFNFTKPAGVANGSKYQIGIDDGTLNDTIPASCLAQNILQIELITQYDVVFDFSYSWNCYNGSSWPSIGSTSGSMGYLYDDAVWWNISGTSTYHNPGALINLANITAGLAAGQNWTLECTAYDGTGYSTGLNSTKIQIAEYNVVPNITSLSISPASPTTLSDLVCYATATDQEREELAINWSWYQNGVRRFSGTTNVRRGINSPIARLGAGNTTKGDVWNCTAMAFDLLDYSAINSTNVTIHNEAPDIGSAQITTDTPYPEPESTLLGWCNATDADGDTLTYNWSWLQDGEEYLSGTTLGGLCFQEDATEYETCGAVGTGVYAHNDESNDGDWTTFSDHGDYYVNYTKPINAQRATTYWQVKTFDDGAGSVITDNLTIPLSCWNRPQLELLSYVSLGSNSLLCYNGSSWLVLGGSCIFDCVLYEEAIRWNISTTGFEEGVNSNVANLSIGFAVGDEWSFECTTNDGTDSSSSLVSEPVTILEGNAEPEIISLIVTPTSAHSDSNLFCNVTIYDPNPVDKLKAEWAWYLDGVEIFSGTTNVTNGTNTLVATLGAGNTSAGDIWNCTIRAFDGWDYSAYGSGKIEILNWLPIISQSTISSNPPGFQDTGILLGKCNATDADLDELQYSWKWFKEGQLNSSGSEMGLNWCYQETANASSACGGLATGRYSCAGDWDPAYGCANTIDEDWATYGKNTLPSNSSIIYINYTKPEGALSSSRWQTNGIMGATNYTIPPSCWNYDEDKLLFRVDSKLVGSEPITLLVSNWSCFNGSWNSISFISDNIYEEAMWWNISRYHRSGEQVDVSSITAGLSAGQNWTFECKAFDGINYSSSLNSSIITIILSEEEKNTAPLITELLLRPTIVYTADALYCNATALDAEDSLLEIEYTWYNGSTALFWGNTSVQNNTNNLISSIGGGNISSGDVWNCTIRAFDGTDYSNYSSDTVTILEEGANLAPSISSLNLTPIIAYISNELYCNVTAVDIENITLDVEWTWYKGEVEMFSGITQVDAGENTLVTTLGAGNTSVGDVWNCTVRAFDGEFYSDNSTTGITIANAPPTILLSTITSYPAGYYYTGDLLGWCNATDADGDNVTYSWKWFRNGVLNSSGSEVLSHPAGISINLANITTGLAAGQVWRFECMANDTLGTSAAVNSSTVTIRSSGGGGGGSTGGGGTSFSSFWTTTYSIDRAKLINGTTQPLGVKQRMKLTLEGGKLLYVGAVSVTSSSATLNLTGTRKEQITLSVGDTFRYDDDNDGTYDLLLTLSMVLQSKAYLYVQEINEPVEATPSPGPETPEEEYVSEPDVEVRPPEQPTELPGVEQDDTDTTTSLTKNIRPIVLAMIVLLIFIVPAFIFIITRTGKGKPQMLAKEASLEKPMTELERLGGYNSKLPDSLLTVQDDETYLPKPLLDYVKKVISMNYPDDEIRYVLLNRGWPSSQVEAAIRLCRKYRWNDDFLPPGSKGAA